MKTGAVTVRSVPSTVPEWYDPSLPGFDPPRDWAGARVRVTLPVGADPAGEQAAARIRLEKKYSGATIHIVPDFGGVAPAASSPAADGTDEELLGRYLATVSMPAHATAAQAVAYLRGFLPRVSPFGGAGLAVGACEAENVLCFESYGWDPSAQAGVTLVTGVNEDSGGGRSNGSGKSSFVSVPFVGLFGRTFKDQTHDGWASQTVEAQAKIVSRFTLPDGRELTVDRRRRPPSLRAWVDGEERTMGRPDATQALIERLAGITWEVCVNAVYMGQREVSSMFGTEKDRKEVFGRLLGMDRFLDAQQAIKKAAKRTARELEYVGGDVDRTRAALAEAEANRAALRRTLDAAPAKVPASVVNAAEAEVAEVGAAVLRAARDIDAFNKAEGCALKEMRERQNESASHRAVARVNGDMLAGTKAAGATCPTCGGNPSAGALSAYRAALQKKVDLAKAALAVSEQLEKGATAAWTKTCADRSETQSKMRELETAKDAVRAQLAELGRAAEERSRAVAALNESAARVAFLKGALAAHEAARTFVLEELEFSAVCAAAVGRDGLPAWLCAAVAPRLNEAAARYSGAFTGGEVGVSFAMSDGEIDVAVVNPNGGRGTIDQSRGEMKMAGIVAAFAARDVLVPLNVLILDEPGDGLDAQNAAAFAAGLNAVADRFKHVIVISHDQNLLAVLEPDRRIEVVKRGRVSKAEAVAV